MIGDHVECIVTSLSVSQLTCLPNTSLVEAPSGRADVVVSVYLYQFCQPYKKIYLHWASNQSYFIVDVTSLPASVEAEPFA